MRAAPLSSLEEVNLYIILVGNPQEGFTIVGPLNKPGDNGGIGEWAYTECGGSEFYEIELQGHSDSKGTAVVFDGDIGRPFEFYGPFGTIEAAEAWAAKNSSGIAMELVPVDHEASKLLRE
jgi:hypothetical protein